MGRTERKPVTVNSPTAKTQMTQNRPGNQARPSSQPQRGGVHTVHDYNSAPSNNGQLPAPGGYAELDANGDKPVPPIFGPPSDDLLVRIFPYAKLFSLTAFLLITNLIVFIAELIVGATMEDGAFVKSNKMGGPSSATLIRMGGKYWPKIYEGHVWRLVTCIFLHSGLLHILSNMFFLARFGWVIEKRWGWWRYLVVYMLAGLGGSLLSCIGSKANVSVGASGALFGIMVANITFVIYNYKMVPRYGMEIGIMAFILLLNIIFGFLGSGVDNFGHLGGLAVGVVAGGCIPLPYVKREKEKLVRLIFLALTVAVLGTFIGVTASLDKYSV